MKILLVAPFPPPYGGIANWSALISRYVKSTEDTLDTLNIAPKKRATEGRGLFDRVVVSGLDMLKKRRELKVRLRLGDIDVIHMTTSGSLAVIRDVLLLNLAEKMGVPAVYHIRFGKTAEMAKKGGIMWRLFKSAMLKAKAVIAIDKATFEAIRLNAPEANCLLVPNPVNTSELPALCDSCDKTVVFLGWVVPTKGVGELVEAWNTVGVNHPDYKLLIIGQAGAEYLSLIKSKAKAENIEFAGEMPHDKAMEEVAKSDIFILPSYTEGFPNAVVEAMALKKAVIGTCVGAIPEMLGDSCGMLINSKSPEEIVSALEELIGNEALKAELAENAYKKVYKQYTVERVYAEYKKIWETVKENEK